jgi:hypothetical protein
MIALLEELLAFPSEILHENQGYQAMRRSLEAAEKALDVR